MYINNVTSIYFYKWLLIDNRSIFSSAL